MLDPYNEEAKKKEEIHDSIVSKTTSRISARAKKKAQLKEDVREGGKGRVREREKESVVTYAHLHRGLPRCSQTRNLLPNQERAKTQRWRKRPKTRLHISRMMSY
jgi:hypothetical protein